MIAASLDPRSRSRPTQEACMERSPIDLETLRTELHARGATWEPSSHPSAQPRWVSRRGTVASQPGGPLAIPQPADRVPSARSSCSHRDWQAEGFITPIRDQGTTSSSMAFGLLATVEAMARIERGIDLDL